MFGAKERCEMEDDADLRGLNRRTHARPIAADQVNPQAAASEVSEHIFCAWQAQTVDIPAIIQQTCDKATSDETAATGHQRG